MNNSPQGHAIARLGWLADLGYLIFSSSSDGNLKQLASSFHQYGTDKSGPSLVATDDPAIAWLAENLGATKSDNISESPLISSFDISGNTTLVSDLYAGSRICMLLSHNKDELTADEIKEARAASLILHIENTEEPEFAITAKELVYLQQISAGATDEDVASELQLSLRAVKERKRKAIEDLGAKNIGHAIGIAKRNNLI